MGSEATPCALGFKKSLYVDLNDTLLSWEVIPVSA